MKGSGKSGKLVANDKGEYEFCVGALNIPNSMGQHYTLEGAKDLFDASSQLMMRVRNGGLYAENGHPTQSGLTNEQYFRRLHSISEERICAFISDLWLDYSSLENTDHPNAVAIMARIKPFGELKAVLEGAIANEKQNVCFSVRGFTRDQQVGSKTHRTLTNIITFDYVTLPGIPVANRSNSGSLEEMASLAFDTNQFKYDRMGTSGTIVEDIKEVYALEGMDLALETLNYYDPTIAPTVPLGSLFNI